MQKTLQNRPVCSAADPMNMPVLVEEMLGSNSLDNGSPCVSGLSSSRADMSSSNTGANDRYSYTNIVGHI